MSTKNKDNTNNEEDNDSGGESENKIVCPFLKHNVQYELGCEFGLLLCRMMMAEEVDDDFRMGNQDQILLLANRLKWSVKGITKAKRGWFHIEMIKVGENEYGI